MLQKLIKIVHEIGAVGVMGSLAASLVLIATAPKHSWVAYAAVRQGIAALTRWLLVPSLAIVLISGLLAIAANRTYANAGWAWVKALLGLGMFEGTLISMDSGARRAAELSALAASGHGDAAQLASVLHSEWGTLWLLLAVALVNILLAVWRPRLVRRTAPT
ncbi:MAG: hypothetical protein WB440_18920 [Steroidobacteraceae bacterium]|jgi:hypothetical protein